MGFSVGKLSTCLHRVAPTFTKCYLLLWFHCAHCCRDFSLKNPVQKQTERRSQLMQHATCKAMDEIISYLLECNAFHTITFIQDGTLLHIIIKVKNFLRRTFTEERSVRIHYTNEWSPCSPDLTPVDFWIWVDTLPYGWFNLWAFNRKRATCIIYNFSM